MISVLYQDSTDSNLLIGINICLNSSVIYQYVVFSPFSLRRRENGTPGPPLRDVLVRPKYNQSEFNLQNLSSRDEGCLGFHFRANQRWFHEEDEKEIRGDLKKGLMHLFRWYESGLESSSSFLKTHSWKSDCLWLTEKIRDKSCLWTLTHRVPWFVFLLVVFHAIVLRPFLSPLAGYAPGNPWLWRDWRVLGQ